MLLSNDINIIQLQDYTNDCSINNNFQSMKLIANLIMILNHFFNKKSANFFLSPHHKFSDIFGAQQMAT
jgi:hypothetical protein